MTIPAHRVHPPSVPIFNIFDEPLDNLDDWDVADINLPPPDTIVDNLLGIVQTPSQQTQDHQRNSCLVAYEFFRGACDNAIPNMHVYQNDLASCLHSLAQTSKENKIFDLLTLLANSVYPNTPLDFTDAQSFFQLLADNVNPINFTVGNKTITTQDVAIEFKTCSFPNHTVDRTNAKTFLCSLADSFIGHHPNRQFYTPMFSTPLYETRPNISFHDNIHAFGFFYIAYNTVLFHQQTDLRDAKKCLESLADSTKPRIHGDNDVVYLVLNSMAESIPEGKPANFTDARLFFASLEKIALYGHPITNPGLGEKTEAKRVFADLAIMAYPNSLLVKESKRDFLQSLALSFSPKGPKVKPTMFNLALKSFEQPLQLTNAPYEKSKKFRTMELIDISSQRATQNLSIHEISLLRAKDTRHENIKYNRSHPLSAPVDQTPTQQQPAPTPLPFNRSTSFSATPAPVDQTPTQQQPATPTQQQPAPTPLPFNRSTSFSATPAQPPTQQQPATPAQPPTQQQSAQPPLPFNRSTSFSATPAQPLTQQQPDHPPTQQQPLPPTDNSFYPYTQIAQPQPSVLLANFSAPSSFNQQQPDHPPTLSTQQQPPAPQKRVIKRTIGKSSASTTAKDQYTPFTTDVKKGRKKVIVITNARFPNIKKQKT
jgi:hypothetical protein